MPSPEQLKPIGVPQCPHRVEGVTNIYGKNGEHAVLVDSGEGRMFEVSADEYVKSLRVPRTSGSGPISLRRQSELIFEKGSAATGS